MAERSSSRRVRDAGMIAAIGVELPLAGLAAILRNSAAKILSPFRRRTLVRVAGSILAAALPLWQPLLSPLVSLGGCSVLKFQKDFWNIEPLPRRTGRRYRQSAE